ncbi:FixH family protein [Mesobacillus jeotgali]|uniref:FixH family protein n=1 Tax=Mesobacillus jeotgali TaxID=129985 RepID=UPI0009A7FC4A|nr:FixH family protein [Mesobacillus jeotgali]
MKQFMITFLVMLLGLFATACTKESAEEEPQFLNVELTANPEKTEKNEEITFEAKVTYGSEEVEDAEEVKFEVWRSQAEKHEKIAAEHAGKGIYRLKKSFEEEGTYYIISHVTARRMHSMPKIEFIVGNPSEPENGSSTGSEKKNEADENNTEHNGH